MPGDDEKDALQANAISKCYRIWESPSARLTGPLKRQLARITGKPNSQPPYKDFHALSEMTLTVPKGQCLGIIGKNGSGKSTLLQVLAGTLQPTTGSVVRNGQVAALLELGTGFNFDFSGRENISLYAGIHGLGKSGVDAIYDSVVAFAGLEEFMEQPLRTYSSGMVVRLAFALLTHLDPDVLIIDEALAVGDAAFVQKCMRWLRDFVKRKTVILVSHDLSAITDLCSRCLWLRNGVVAFDGHPKRATELYLESIYDDDAAAKAASDSPPEEELPADAGLAQPVDARFDALQAAPLRNELTVFQFKPDTASFGERQATIEHVELLDDAGRALKQTAGGEIVRLRVRVRAEVDVFSPIVGFGVKNRLGQELFHDNTFLSGFTKKQPPLEVTAGHAFVAEFCFRLPYFPAGEYFIFAAVATGTHDDHAQQHWVHEALRFTATPERICLGLIGLPMLEVNLHHDS